MKPIYLFRSLVLCSALSFALTPYLFADNAQPWDEQDAERDAQEEMTSSERSAQEEMSSSIYGRITNINLDEKILSLLPTDEVEDTEEEDDDGDASQDYHFKSDTPLTGMGSLSELAAGDYVTLDYYNFRDKNRIREISFDKHEEKDDATEAKAANPGVLIG